MAVPLHPLRQVPLGAEFIELADDLPGASADVIVLALELIQLFEHRKRNDDLIVVKHIQRCGIVQQDVGVQNEVFDRFVAALLGCGQRGISEFRRACCRGHRRVTIPSLD